MATVTLWMLTYLLFLGYTVGEFFKTPPRKIAVAVGQPLRLEWQFLQSINETMTILVVKDFRYPTVQEECHEVLPGLTCKNSTGHIWLISPSAKKSYSADYKLYLTNGIQGEYEFQLNVIDITIEVYNEEMKQILHFPNLRSNTTFYKDKDNVLDLSALTSGVGKEYYYHMEIQDQRVVNITCYKNVEDLQKNAKNVNKKEIRFSTQTLQSDINKRVFVECVVDFGSFQFYMQQRIFVASLEYEQTDNEKTNMEDEFGGESVGDNGGFNEYYVLHHINLIIRPIHAWGSVLFVVHLLCIAAYVWISRKKLKHPVPRKDELLLNSNQVESSTTIESKLDANLKEHKLFKNNIDEEIKSVIKLLKEIRDKQTSPESKEEEGENEDDVNQTTDEETGGKEGTEDKELNSTMERLKKAKSLTESPDKPE